MLLPSEFIVGCLGDASGLVLLLPRGNYEHPFLITSASGSPVAICLDGENRFMAFGCAGNASWSGIIFPSVAIELDEESVSDADGYYPPLATMVRKDATLNIMARVDGGMRTVSLITVLAGLPQGRENASAAFARWQITIGEGILKRVLKSIDVAKKQAA